MYELWLIALHSQHILHQQVAGPSDSFVMGVVVLVLTTVAKSTGYKLLITLSLFILLILPDLSHHCRPLAGFAHRLCGLVSVGPEALWPPVVPLMRI